MYIIRNKILRLYLPIFIRNKSTLPKASYKKTKCGQPTVETHPHLLKSGEIMPHIQSSEFQNRRQNLINLINLYYSKLIEDVKEHLVVIPSASKKYMSDKIPYVFRQNTDYLYLSGCLEPDSCLVLNTKGITDHTSTLFVRNPDSHSELWDGPRTSADSAPKLFGVNQALSMSDLQSFINSFTSTKKCVLWYEVADVIQPDVNRIIRELIQEQNHVRIESPKGLIHKLRLFKSPAEIQLMKKTCEIASEAINETIAISKPGITEHQLFAQVDYSCRMKGAEYLAYPPVVAGGDRATIIHYINNNQVVHSGEMVLMDAGCECHGYSSDITRTWPVNGRFSPQQRMLYEIIQSVQQDLLQMLTILPSLNNLFDVMCNNLGKKLQEAGLISRNAPSEAVFKTAYEFCPHHCSHFLGMDVHDTSLIPRSTKLQPGMVITVEPGIYISDRHNVPSEFQGIGIRIEDDVLITENGPVILTDKCIRNIDDIENILNAKRK